MVTNDISEILIDAGLDSGSVARMLDHYKKLRFYFGNEKYEEVGLHVGKFCENVGNLILGILGEPVETSPSMGSILTKIEAKQTSGVDVMIRLVIPRFLRAAYELRSRRDAVHTNLSVSVNHVDASMAVHLCNWILAELVRVYTGTQNIVVARNLIENFAWQVNSFVDEYDGKRLIMSNKLSVPDEILVHLNNSPGGELDINLLVSWIPNTDVNHIRTVLRQLRDKRVVFYSKEKCKITPLGVDHITTILNGLKNEAEQLQGKV